MLKFFSAAVIAVAISAGAAREFIPLPKSGPSDAIPSVIPAAQPAPEIPNGSEFKAITVPIFLEGATQAAGRLRLGHVFKDYRRKGFFKIGLLPMMVVEEAVVEIKPSAGALSVLRCTHDWLRPVAGTNAEIRSFAIRVQGEVRARFEADRLQVLPDAWVARGSRVILPNGECVTASRVEFILTGPMAGEVRGLAPSALLITDIFPKTTP